MDSRGINVQKGEEMKRIVLLAAFLYCSNANAVDVYTNYEERLGETQKLDSLTVSDDTFGAKIDPATGATSFYVPVLSIPGNNGLDLSIVYKLSIEKVANHTEWRFEQDDPYIGGSFSQERGWLTYNGSTSRCSAQSNGSKPPRVSDGRNGWFEPDEYWSGYQLSLQGGGGSSLAYSPSVSTTPLPSTGGPFKWAANGDWFFSCIPLVLGSGEGFLGYSPDGLKYHFNTMRNFPLATLNKIDEGGKDVDLDRYEIRIYAGKIEDRFGNYVSGLTASDGRAVTRTVSGSVVTYKYGTRQWTVNTAAPFTVTYPDGSQWKATVSGSIYDVSYNAKSCTSVVPDVSPATTSVAIKTPSGATGTYNFKQAKIGYTYMVHHCASPDNVSSVSVRPSFFVRTVLASRTISGPGVPTSSLSIDYGAVNNCFTDIAPKCTASSPTVRVVKHTETGGKFKKYTYGNRAYVDADLLLKLEEGQSTSVLRTTEYGYILMPRAGYVASQNYSTSAYFPSSSKRVVTISRKVKEGGSVFEWKVLKTCGSSGTDYCVDAFGRPTKVQKESNVGT